MKLFTDCSGECCICACGGGCLAGHGDDDFSPATNEQILERLKNGNYPDYRQIMIDELARRGIIYTDQPRKAVKPMSDRDRLIDLIEKAEGMKNNDFPSIEEIADYLLANGVIVLPCQKGAVLNRNGEKCIANHWNIILTAFNVDNHVRLFDIKEAEKALKEREQG